MKRNKIPQNQVNGDAVTTKRATLQAYKQLVGTIAGRLDLASRMGQSFGGERDLYASLGYPKHLTFEDFFTQYTRQDAAGAIINRPINATWRGSLSLLESKDDKETELEKAWKQLNKTLKLKNKFIRLDKLASIGEFAVLLMGFSDVKGADEWIKPVDAKKGLKLLYVKPFAQNHAVISTWEKDPTNPRYGLPSVYELTFAEPGEPEETFSVKVHHSRVLHVTTELLEDEVYGVPSLQRVYNRLKDLEKLTGGSAEMFWRGARPGYQSIVKDDYNMGEEEEEELSKQIAEYEHHLRRILKLQGAELKELASQVSDPGSHIDVQIQMISMITGIPKRILVGSERGELASSQDQDTWKEIIQVRREEYAEPKIIFPFVDRCIEYKILPPSTDEYSVDWVDLFVVSDKDKAETGRARASAIKEYLTHPEAEVLIPAEAFLEHLLGLGEEQINTIMEMREAALKEMEDFELEGDELEQERREEGEGEEQTE